MRIGFGDTAFAEANGVPSADGEGLVVSSVTYQNLSAKSMTFDFRRATGVSVLARTVNPGQTLTTLNVPGSVANRTIVRVTAGWG